MEWNDTPLLDPRAMQATSVSAQDRTVSSAEPQALKITAASSNPQMFMLPWELPLSQWPTNLL